MRYQNYHYRTRRGPDYDVDVATGCWIWRHSITPNGYGLVWREGQPISAHRYYYELAHGSIPDKRHLHHTCEVKRCVNPGHLRPLTAAEHLRLHRS